MSNIKLVNTIKHCNCVFGTSYSFKMVAPRILYVIFVKTGNFCMLFCGLFYRLTAVYFIYLDFVNVFSKKQYIFSKKYFELNYNQFLINLFVIVFLCPLKHFLFFRNEGFFYYYYEVQTP